MSNEDSMNKTHSNAEVNMDDIHDNAQMLIIHAAVKSGFLEEVARLLWLTEKT